MFKKKVKKSTEELKAERDAKMKRVSEEMRGQLLALQKQKNMALNMLMEARAKNLPEQERQARGALRQCIATEKRTEGMLMSLELAVLSSNLAELNHNFMEAIGELSDVVVDSQKKTDVKKVEEKYMKSLYAKKKQEESIDEMLEVGKYAEVASMGEDRYTEYDGEIDSLLENAEKTPNRFGKQRY